METNQVLKLLSSHPGVKRLDEAIKKRKSDIVVDGLIGSSAALYFAAILNKTTETTDDVSGNRPYLFVMDDEESAGYFYHDLSQMLEGREVLFFPSSYRRAIKYNQKDDANEILRTNVLTIVNSNRESAPYVIVTYPEALAEQVVSRQNLEQNSITIQKGGMVDVTELEKNLFALGFTRTDYVYEPGQFAVRGSIVDVYSFSNETPYRLDFFGDEVDSIRTFDIQSQLSEGRVDSVTIVPELFRDNCKYIPFTSFLPKDTVLVSHDIGFVADKIDVIKQDGFSRQALIETTDEQTTIADGRLLSSREDFLADVATMRKVTICAKNHAERSADASKTINIGFDTGVQPLFHKNFDLVTSEFERLLGNGYTIFICSDSERQIQRLEDIFDANRKGEMLITFNPVLKTIHEGFVDNDTKRCFFTDHQLFDRYHKFNLKSEKARRGKVALTLKEIQQFGIGDYVVHVDHGIGKFGGLVRVPTNGQMQEMIKIVYQNDDIVYVSIHSLSKVSKYKGREGEPPRLSKLGTGAWERMKEKVKTKVKDIARDLIRLYSQRMKESGFAFTPDSYLQQELEASFIYEDTPDQLKATQEVKADMEKSQPMDRLVCGDVGFGKTEVAIRAAFKAATDGKQVAVLVPTTVLAYQHYKTFSERLKEFPVKVDYLSRARTATQTNEVLEGLKEGKVDIIIGTHALIGKRVKFKDLGLLIIDEEQKFGVSVKEKLRQAKVNVDTLTMTATPIPRTLQFSLMGARDMSIIQTPPANRYPIQTEIHTFSPEIIAEAINFEMSRNGQVFFVNNKVSNLEELRLIINKYVPDARVCIGHGQMNPQDLEQVIFDFMNFDYDVMLSTTIVENGIDIPNANTIIINAAQNYGLSDLHQMRGRVGRGNKKAFCYLLAPPMAVLKDDARRRLQALENFSDLGSGIHIAMQDLDIRGAGNLLGAEQSGFIADLGYETYQKVLAEAMNELKYELADNESEEEGDKLDEVMIATPFVTESTIESELVAYFPDEYVPSSSERISLYRELDSLTNQSQLDAFRARLADRFGPVPEVGEELLRVIQVKWIATKLGIERVLLKGGNMFLYMVSDNASKYYESAAFDKLITYASWHPRDTKLREIKGKRSVCVFNIRSVSEALKVLNEIETPSNQQ